VRAGLVPPALNLAVLVRLLLEVPNAGVSVCRAKAQQLWRRNPVENDFRRSR
jgi:hypothetical protein